MTSKEIRKSFLDFFRSKDHRIIDSAPVVPHGDPTLLFTNAGMNQFKDVFLGQGTRDYKRAADTQKCIRVSGKHNDLEEVGVDTYHHTFFEMLGNWSFGDYYKVEAIDWAWELLTKVWKLPVERLHATVYKTDDEAFELWKKYLPESRIHRFAEKDNFWEMGETGPCGPCSEIHFDRTADLSGGPLVNAGVPEVIEIWNLVFIQYNRKADGSLEPLAHTHVDTGMGFERICAVMQGKNSNYDSDVFTPILAKIEELSGKKYNPELTNPDGIAMRVIADHLRALSFAIADGAIPGNEGRSYVLRRLLRRASRYARNLGFKEPVIYKLLPTLIDIMGEEFPELVSHKTTIEKVIKGEEDSFLQTLERGLEVFEDIIKKDDTISDKVICGEDAFLLYDTFGFPLDLTELIAREKGFGVDIQKFDEKMAEQKERSRKARKVHSQEADLPVIDSGTKFVGYELNEISSTVVFVQENMIALEETPFYTESGGQISDIGTITLEGEIYNVIDLRKSGNAVIHFLDREPGNVLGQKALAKIDIQRRLRIKRNHSATHLLHEALRMTLGEHVQQAGSLVSPDYLRFDFNHFEKVTNEQIKEIEKIVNRKIFENIDISIKELDLDEAKKNPKIKMFFGDKYGDVVRVVTMDEKYSSELCGGTHVANTSDIGIFKIVSESSIAAGVRRIEAITGDSVEKFILDLEEKLIQKEKHEDELKEKIRHLEKQISGYKLEELNTAIPKLIESAKLIKEVKVISVKMEFENLDQLRSFAEKLRDELASKGLALVASIIDNKVQLCCVATDDLKNIAPAGKIVGDSAKVVSGGGGGKPHLATAGGKDISMIDDLVEKEFYSIVEKYL